MEKQYLSILMTLLLCFLVASPGFTRDAKTLIAIQDSEVVGLDLMRSSLQNTMSVCYNIHDTLFHPQEDASVKPALGEKWEQDNDLTWMLTLKKDIKFHNVSYKGTGMVSLIFTGQNQKINKTNNNRESPLSS